MSKTVSKNRKFFKTLKYVFKALFKIIKRSYKQIFLFVVASLILNVFVTQTISKLFLRLGLKITGLSYVCADNALQFFLNPFCIILVIVLFLLLGLITIFQIAGLIHGAHMAFYDEKVTFGGMCASGINCAFGAIKPKNLPMILYLLVLLPFTNTTSLISGGFYVSLPEFIEDFINSRDGLNIVYQLSYLMLIFLSIFFVFSIFRVVIEKKNFVSSCKYSFKLVHKNTLLVFVTLILVNAIIKLGSVAISSAGTNIVTSFLKAINGKGYVESPLFSRYITFIAKFISAAIGPSFTIAALTVLFNRFELKELMDGEYISNTVKNRSFEGKYRVIAIIFAIASLIINFFVTPELTYAINSTQSPRPQVIAHRGDSKRRPENSMPAFELSLIENTDWVELDVQETKDGVLVVAHDDDLSHITGKPIKTHEITYAELKEMDVGSWFSDEFSNLHISTLKEVLTTCKGKAKVQIEIKYPVYDDNIEKKVLDVINECDMHDEVLVLSLTAEPLIKIKELDPTITTAYCLSIAYASIENVEFADVFSIEAQNVIPSLVHDIHKAGKSVCVWTVNSASAVQYLVDCGVDAILTDDPIMMQSELDNINYSGGFARAFRLYANSLINGY